MAKLSIVTPSYNQAPYLCQTIDSVLSQQGAFSLEHIVIDGGSTDGSVDLLRDIDDPRLLWVSEDDQGQTQAINKGLLRATGDVVGYLNSDDLYVPGALAAVNQAFDEHPQANWLIGQCVVIDDQGREIRRSVTRYKNRRLRRYRYHALLRENFISQMGVFWRRSFGEQVGPLDETLYYTMDYDLWLRMGGQGDPLVMDQVLAQFRLHSGSKSGEVNREQFDEQYRVALRYFQGDTVSRWVHRLNVEKVVWAYRLMQLVGR